MIEHRIIKVMKMNLKEKCPRGNKSGKKQLLEDRGRGFVAR
jgi:hypothetical protein